jgi:hypothetical protein
VNLFVRLLVAATSSFVLFALKDLKIFVTLFSSVALRTSTSDGAETKVRFAGKNSVRENMLQDKI